MVTAVIVGVVALAVIALIAWLVHDVVSNAHATADTRVGQAVTEEHLERTQFELEVERKARIASEQRAAALEEQLAHELSSPFPDATLDPADTRGRMLRLAQRWGQADVARSSVPAESTTPVPVHSAASPPDATSLVSVGGDRVVP